MRPPARAAIPMLVVLAALITGYSPADAATWIVDPGGGGHALTIAGGLALAGYGDSVLVTTGTYYENLVMKNGVVLRSQNGAEFTTIDGSDAGPILFCSGVDATSAIEGFKLTHARGDSVGGAIVCLGASSPRIAENIIVDNRSRYGAAIGCASHSSPLVENNIITDNVSDQECGGVLGINQCNLVVRNNVMRRNRALTKSGGAMWFGDECRVTITDNVITDNSCPGGGGGGVWLGNTGGVSRIERNLFARNDCGIHGGAIYGGAVFVLIRNNTIDDCTAVSEGGGIWIWTGSSVIENNIVTRCNVGAVGTEGGAVVGCNDLWNNPDGDYIGTITPGPGDLFVDPLYCDPENDDYRLAVSSPCLNPAGCGLMGAFGAGCGPTATEPATWGHMKATFR